ncbi:metallophosphoesterase family protein [Caldisphaera lagunensis]|uniref:metallophosphoesterase family protein n=1 Tax=Caldisphaera lagunensis TaxID=200415 RepID=UPI0024801AA4|nr:metallophosphoesterase [Caldisphaera lagunensis]
MYAASDIHYPHYFKIFKDSLDRLNEEPCLFLFAGDIIDKGKVEGAKFVFESIVKRFNKTKIVATFGNDEWNETWDTLRNQYAYVDWIVDDYKVYLCDNTSIAVIGTPGALDKPTRWQLKNINNIEEIYNERIKKIRELIINTKKSYQRIILLSHYALSKLTLKGENPYSYGELYSSKMEKVILETRPDVAIHGHAHKGTAFAMLQNIPIYNVAIPLVKGVTKIKFSKTIETFL